MSINVMDQVITEQYAIYNGDSAEVLRGIPDNSIGMSIFSPPFMSLYVYSPSDRDLGNCNDPELFWTQFSFISKELLRVLKPGRSVCVHVAQVSSTLNHDGVIGLKDFRGDTIRHFVDAGFVYHGEICIDKCPQAQAIRTKSKALLFVQLKKDSSWLRPALADYIVVFRKPGANTEPIVPDISNEDWIEWARPIWYGIRESGTLNVAEGRVSDDERHICALQLETIHRCLKLWSNPGDTICSPFGGIGSEGYEAVKIGRKAVLCELKSEYYNVACKNLKRAVAYSTQGTLLELMESGEGEEDAALLELKEIHDCEGSE